MTRHAVNSRRTARAATHSLPARGMFALAMAIGALVAPAGAQTDPGMVWVPFDASPAGTPAEITLLAASSSPSSTTFDLTLHGFWSLDRVGPDLLTYQQISVPGLQSLLQVGAPELPALRFDLGIVTGASAAVLQNVEVLAQSVLPNMKVLPHYWPARPDTTGEVDQFVRDPLIYDSPLDFPGTPGIVDAPASRLSGTLFAASCEVHPFRWNGGDVLTVDRHVRYTFAHAGSPQPAETATERTAAMALARLLNGPVLDTWLTSDPYTYTGEFLFLYPQIYAQEIAPLVWQKKTRGFKVTTEVLENIGTYCTSIRNYITAWYAASSKKGDHYCILVGDVDKISTCVAGYFVPPVDGYIETDDLYGDADGDGTDDPWEEVYVGRLSVNSEWDCDNQVAKILDYEDHPTTSQDYDTATLVAWRYDVTENRFEDAQDQAAGFAYASPVTFTKLPGSQSYGRNSYVDLELPHTGIVCYQGHGSVRAWDTWNTAAESYLEANFLNVRNGPATPVVWALSCFNGDINSNDCMNEWWMEGAPNSAVAAYGGTRETYIAGNKVLNQELFKAVFHYGLTTHAKAIEWAEYQCTLVDRVFNEFSYLLLGDPEMEIRRSRVESGGLGPFDLDYPPIVDVGCDFGGGCCPECPGTPFDVAVNSPLGAPLQGVLVSLYKQPGPVSGAAATPASALSGSDEVLVNGYTDATGHATFVLPPLAAGTLYVTARDFDGNSMRREVPVQYTSDVTPGVGRARLSAAPSVMLGRTTIRFGVPLEREASVLVFDLSGRRIRELRAARGADGVSWDGTDQAGASVAPGLYLARLAGNEGAGCARITRLR